MSSLMKSTRHYSLLKRLFRQDSSYSQLRHLFVTFADSEKRWLSRQPFKTEDRHGHSFKNDFTKRQLSASPAVFSTPVDTHEEDGGIASVLDTADLDEVSFDQSIENEVGGDDELSHLRLKLYPLEESEEVRSYLERLYEAASIQQVFDIVQDFEKCHPDKTQELLKISSQALVTIWDLQKLLFKISSNFDPERDFFDKPSFIEKVSNSPIFIEKIVQPIVSNCESLEDEPLLASLLCLKRMNFGIKSAECQKFMEEILLRVNSLSLPSISRLCVCMRSESLYGMFITSKFYPLLESYVESMSTDIEVRLVAISLRNTLRIVSSLIVDKFRTRIAYLIDSSPEETWETVTLCKSFLLLMACRGIGTESRQVFEKIGELLIPRVETMQLMDLLSLQKFLELGFLHPYGLVDALVTKMMRTVQEGISNANLPRLDLLANIAPHLKSTQQRSQLTAMLKEYLSHHSFQLAPGILCGILRWSRSGDVKVHNLFWSKAAAWVDDSYAAKSLDRRILKLSRDYLNFIYSMSFTYRHRQFEWTTKKYLHFLMDNYKSQSQPCLLQPGDFSRAFTFLLGCASLSDQVFNDLSTIRLIDDFAPQFQPGDLVALSRGLESVLMHLFYGKRQNPMYYDRILETSSILEEQCSKILMEGGGMKEKISFPDLLAIHKSALVTRKIKGESPVLDATMERILQSDIDDARSFKDLAQHLLNGLNNYPEATRKIESYLWRIMGEGEGTVPVSPELIEKYVTLSFCVGWEPEGDGDIYKYCGEILRKDWEKLTFLGVLQAGLALCHYKSLPEELVQNIFSVEFLDQLDGELSTSFKSTHYPLRLRQAMMELNRAVCIDMPHVNLPWFHAKFCEEMLAMHKFQETYLHDEVRKVLGQVVGDASAVQANLISPYYYYLDFLIEFDEKSRPIRKKNSSKGFLSKLRGQNQNSQNSGDRVSKKVAVLLLTPSAFTRSVRQLRGQMKLRRRHLEILGYHVIEIDPKYWNSMFMSENSVRHSFIESKLYSSAVG